MSEPTLVCPHCSKEIRLTESLAAPLIAATKREYERLLFEKDEAITSRENAVAEQATALERKAAEIEKRVSERISAEREKIAAEEQKRARLLLGDELSEKDVKLADLQDLLRRREEKLKEAAKTEAAVIEQQRKLEDAQRELEVTVQKRVQSITAEVREAAKREAIEDERLKLREKEEQIAGMQRQIEDLKRRAEQGSQQLQGEAQELDLESMLATKFPRDTIVPVAKGEYGGDLIHRVFGSNGQEAGTILWEAKRTKNWSDGWLAKLRADQRNAKADLALIVSQALPRDMNVAFDLIDGVWVTEPKCAGAVAVALRESLIALSAARQAGEGQQTKSEMIYEYLTGPRFRQRVEAIVEKFTDMQEDLSRERRAMTKLWARREEQIHSVVESTAGMYGDLQGIAGRNLQEIEALELLAVEGPREGNDPVGS
ncbi:MAG TPA: DUF2130 domain-containing protein [Allosphingosinicella sp.]|nr:DUF2130 domain-containing protein [Allosphingosinicella sp.]HYG30951.1 DUF2130 domain-containing protein [Allosphingosinicella sp.]